MDIPAREYPAGPDEEEDAGEQTGAHDQVGALVERRHEQPDYRRNPHHAGRDPPQQRAQPARARPEDEDGHRAHTRR